MKTGKAVSAWILLFFVVELCSLALEVEHNMIYWHWQGFTRATVGWSILYAVAVVAMLGVAPFTRGRAATTTMWIALVLLAVMGASGLRPELVEEGPKPRTPSPLLYRGTHATALMLPLALVSLRRREGKRVKPADLGAG